MGTLLEHNTPLSKETSDPFALSIPSNPQSRFQSPQIPQIWESKPLLPVLQVELDSHCPFSSRHPLSSLSYLCTMLSTSQRVLTLPTTHHKSSLPILNSPYVQSSQPRSEQDNNHSISRLNRMHGSNDFAFSLMSLF